MWLTSSLCLELPPTFCLLRSRQTRLSFPSSNSLLPISKRCDFVTWRSISASVQKKPYIVCCSQLEVENDLDVEACELVNGSELIIGEGSDRINALLFSAVKNNNGVGILLLSDIFGLEDSYNRDFAYRVACNGYNVLVPDLFRGDPWSRERSEAMFEEWLARQEPNRVAKDIAASTKWMVDEFKAAGLSKKLGVIGFCFGGARLLEVLARDEKSIFGTGVSYYGSRMDPSTARNVKVPVLLITGSRDPLCTVDTVNEVNNAIANESKVVIFEGRGHGFVHRPQTSEDDDDAEEAFMIMRNWLSDQLINEN
ncbi:hypothetical protein RND81_03G227700 [Saponaria officinalis]|uniref:Carboxymethylenebutenolidase homolog n=1 Tax=Saponaria officinalis TaxID=3572 RepID=A0AAW1MA36_SAPOF